MRARTGPKLDAVIRTVEDNTHEFGGVEVARTDAGGAGSTKRLGDAGKLVRAMRDMLFRLHERVGHDEGVVRRVQVVGVVCAGVKMQAMRMGCWRGGVAVLVPEMELEVPVEIGGAKRLWQILAGVQRLKVRFRGRVERGPVLTETGGCAGFGRRRHEAPRG